MTLLLLGLLLFLGAHSVRMLAPTWRLQLLRSRGEGAWKGVYSLASLLGLALLCWGFAQARLQPVLLWVPAAALRHLTALLMLACWVLLVAAYVPGNSVKSRVGHPMVLAVQTWALAHLLANGGLAQVLLFGSFLLWAVACFISMRRRDRVAAARPLRGRLAPPLVTLALGLLGWVVFAKYLHPLLLGVRVMA
ncbi:MAG: NnrU family protein [Betaproteobacteria bacterium]